MRKRPLLVVEWDDIAGYKSWKREDALKEACPTRCVTVGWKMLSNRQVLRLASTRNDMDECVDLEVIPRGCIRSIRILE